MLSFMLAIDVIRKRGGLKGIKVLPQSICIRAGRKNTFTAVFGSKAELKAHSISAFEMLWLLTDEVNYPSAQCLHCKLVPIVPDHLNFVSCQWN